MPGTRREPAPPAPLAIRVVGGGRQPGGQERREFARHAVAVPARLATHGGQAVPCTIRDFCLSGMFVAPAAPASDWVDRFPRGTAVTVAFHSGLDRRGYRLEGSVARVAASGLGLSFRDQGLLALSALNNLTEAETLEEPRPRDPAALERARSVAAKELEPRLPGMVDAFLHCAEETLFHTADAARSDARQRLLLDAMTALRKTAPEVKAGLLAAVPAGLAQMGRFAVEPGEGLDERTAPGLALVDTTEFEDFLAVNEMIVHLKEGLAGELGPLAARFGALFTEPVTDHSNPLGVTAFVQAFHGALAATPLEAVALELVYDCLEGVLADHLREFYGALNAALDHAGFRPAEPPRPAIVRPRETPRRPPPATPVARAGEDDGDGAAAAGDEGGGADVPPDLDHKLAAIQDAYQAAQQLLALRRMPPELDAERTINPAAALEERQRVVEALEALQAAPPAAPGGLRQPLEDALAAAGGPGLAADQADLVELMDEVVTAVQQDPRTSPALRRRLGELAAPLHKAAFLDPRLLADGQHPVRRLLDGVGRLDEELEVAGRPVGEHLDGIVSRVRREFRDDFETFARAVGEVDALAAAQERAFQTNLARVIADSEAKARLIAQRHGDTVGDALERLPQGLGEYAGLMARLGQGDGLLVQDRDGHHVETRVGWVHPRHHSYVLVDRNGRRFQELSAQELALALKRRSATLLGEPRRPLFDGALYHVMHRMHEEIRLQASRDPLTGLANAQLFREELARVLEEAAAGGEFVLAHLNLDRFQLVNDDIGREAGDALLESVARLLEQAEGLRLAARTGGDEFALLLADCDLADGERRMEALRRRVDGLAAGGGSGIPVSASIGLVAVTAGSAVEVLERASVSACRSAKEQGRNRVHASGPDSVATSQRDDMIHWMSTLYQLIGRHSDSLRLHRIAPLDPADPYLHYEVLLGFRDGDGRLLRPDKLVAAAEYYDQSRNLDRWVLRTAIRWFGARPRLLESINGFAVNLSGRSVTDETLAGDVGRLLAAHGVAATKLIFEITETAAVDNFTVAARFIEDMGALGCRFALDDFGAGHSGFTYLRRLPVDYVKIDGIFVKDLLANPADEAVVRSVNEIAHFMGAKTIAEYVENEALMVRLREIGVDYGQGFGIEKPIFLDQWPG